MEEDQLPGKEKPVETQDWIKFTREIICEERDQIRSDFRQILKEEWQTTVNTIKRVDRIEKILIWVVSSQLLQWIAIITLLIKAFKLI